MDSRNYWETLCSLLQQVVHTVTIMLWRGRPEFWMLFPFLHSLTKFVYRYFHSPYSWRLNASSTSLWNKQNRKNSCISCHGNKTVEDTGRILLWLSDFHLSSLFKCYLTPSLCNATQSELWNSRQSASERHSCNITSLDDMYTRCWGRNDK
jgi:hypothetical protein